MPEIEIMKVQPWGEGQGDHVLINVSDFDPASHTPFDAAEAAKVGITEAKAEADKGDADGDDENDAQGAMKVADIRAALTAKGIDFDPKAKKAELRALLEAQA